MGDFINNNLKVLLNLQTTIEIKIVKTKKILKNDTNELKKVKAYIKALGYNVKRKIPLDLEYNPNACWRRKITYILFLSKENGITVKELAKEMIRLHPNEKYSKMYKRVQDTLRYLIHNDHIIKIGQFKSRYILKTDEEYNQVD